MPVSGTGFAYTFDNPDAPSQKPVQYFETWGHRGIWADGWKAVTRHTQRTPYSDDEWELYHVAEDFSESHNLAVQEPERLRVLIDRWWAEAGRNDVLPLDDRASRPTGPARHPVGTVGPPARFHYTPPISHLPMGVTPPLATGEWTLTADIERSDTSIQGVLFALGSINAGVSLYVRDNRLRLDYNVRTQIVAAHSTQEIPAGRVTVGARLDAERGDGGGQITLIIAGSDAGTTAIPSLAVGVRRGGADAGLDRLSPVTPNYDAPFPFTGTIHSVDLTITPFPGGAAPPPRSAVEESAES